ncbi:DUF2799 domain-containing protein [Microbulbifer sp. SAOS-129_SWC]|uniref:DUF2799 domain-containing protein n=1 Tax=Microbulbifer sp. SAOS-129_SWC TaxID=3145235 RepID=UPI003217E9C5
MNFIDKKLITAALVALLGGCAGMSEEECMVADWHALGFEDGAAGAQVAQLSRRRQACADYGVRPDTEAYRAGRSEGLRLYCTEQRGYRSGRAGQTYTGVCPANLEGPFLNAYQAGRDLYLAQHAVDEVAAAIHDHEVEREQLADDITDKSARLISDEATRDERITLLADIARMKKRQGELGTELDDLHQELALRQADYQNVEMNSPYR